MDGLLRQIGRPMREQAVQWPDARSTRLFDGLQFQMCTPMRRGLVWCPPWLQEQIEQREQEQQQQLPQREQQSKSSSSTSSLSSSRCSCRSGGVQEPQ